MNPLKTKAGRGVAGTLVLALAIAGALGCKREVAPDRRTGPAAADLTGLEEGVESDDADAGCEEGATRHCKVTLAVHGKVTSCFEGVRICEDGEWGNCTDPPDDDED